VTQLIRHTVEKLKLDYAFEFPANDGTLENVQAIVQATPSYSRFEQWDVLEENLCNPVRHGYFAEYSLLQKLCIQILREEKIGFGTEDDEVHGIIIDVAWLWEEYLNTLLAEDFIHPENKNSTGGISLFTNWTSTVYPDFYSKDRRIVLDAKYKRMDASEKGIHREDRYQIISYLHVLRADMAGIAYPSQDNHAFIPVGELNGFGGELFKLPLLIPQGAQSFEEFVEEILMNEKVFARELVMKDIYAEI
jgi:5-methylcytosine-specific restriction endonuclease McrBC regulatory subunit McrC